VDKENVAPPERTSAYVFGRILALLLVLMTLTSSFYPAVDAVAGEKERGTMETLLVAPCGRTELVLGKFGAVLAVTLAAALLNLGSLALTTGPLLSAMGPGKIPALELTGSVLLGILVLLVPLAALFSAVSLSLSTLARSVKEAQHYLSPLVMLVMPLAMVVVLPNLPLTETLAAVPVTNAVLFFRDLMLGKTEWATTVIVMVSTFGFAALSIWSSILLFLREETLFRGPEGSGTAVRRPAPRPVPTVPSAVFLFCASLAALWYSQGIMPKDIAASVLVQQLAIVLGPCILFAWWLRVDVGRTFRLARPDSRAWIGVAAGIPLGLALPVLGVALQRAVVGEVPQDAAFHQLEVAMEGLLARSSGLRLVALIAVLPALCEELVFRGFLLSGFAGAEPTRRSRTAALLVSSALFALFHVYPEKWANTFAVGAVLGWLALRTGSLLPGLVAHAVHNAAAVLASKYGKDTWVEEVFDASRPAQTSWLLGAAAVTIAGLVVVHLATRGPRGEAARGT
jgi:sodium transport system permease protein